MADGEPKDAPEKKRDLLFVHGPTPKGDGYRVIRAREDRVEIGEMSDVKEGEPIRGEVVRLKKRPEDARLFDVDVVVPREEAAAPRSGPPKVASSAYRANWEAIFSPPPKRELLN